MDVCSEVLAAERRIRAHVQTTSLVPSAFLGEIGNCHVFLKLENQQTTGSFKVRGALNKLLSLSDEVRNNGVVTASTGNHGLGVAHALSVTSGTGVVFVPTNADRSKLARIEETGLQVLFSGADAVESEIAARQHALVTGKPFISSYNDPQIIAGQGTIGIELLQQQPDLDTIYVAVGGGGLISGIGGYLKSQNAAIRVVGCLPLNSPVMYESIRAGHIVDMECKPTLSDGTAGGIEADAITFELCKSYVDDFVIVTEEEIKQAMRLIFEKHQLVMEGAASVAVAGFIKAALGQLMSETTKAVILLCGGNINVNLFRRLIAD